MAISVIASTLPHGWDSREASVSSNASVRDTFVDDKGINIQFMCFQYWF